MIDQYATLFVEAILSQLVFPLATDTRFFAMQLFGGYNVAAVLLTMIIGATIGMSANYGVGRLLSRCQGNGKSVIPQKHYDAWHSKAAKLMPLAGIFCWIPIVMGIFLMIGGFFRAPARRVVSFILLGQSGYYSYQLMG